MEGEKGEGRTGPEENKGGKKKTGAALPARGRGHDWARGIFAEWRGKQKEKTVGTAEGRKNVGVRPDKKRKKGNNNNVED